MNARRGSRLRRAATSRVRGTRGMCPATASVRHAHVHLQPTYRFPMFDSLQLGTRAPAASQPPSVARSPSSCSPPPALFSTITCSLARCRCCCGSLSGGAELQGGGHGGCGGASGRRPSSGGSGGPPARLRQFRRRFAARQRHALFTRCCRKKNAHVRGRFAAIPACLCAPRHASRTPEARATHRYVAHALGPRTQNTIIRPTDDRVWAGQR